MSKDITIKIDLSAHVTVASLNGALRSFFRWWCSEIFEQLPTGWANQLSSGSGRASLKIADDGWSLMGRDEIAIPLPTNIAPHDLRDELSRKAPDSFRQSVDVTLPRQAALFKRHYFPRAAEARLKQVVRLQLDRLSPFRGDDVMFDCWLLPEGEGALPLGREDSIGVEIAILPKRSLFEFENSIRALGLTPHIFRVANSPATFAPVGLPWTKHSQRRAMISVLGISLILAAIVLSPGLGNREISDLRSQIEAVRPKVERAQAERDELSRYQLPPQALSADRSATMDLVQDLTKRLPDSASVTRLRVVGRNITIEGRTTAQSDIRAAISRSPMLSDVRSTDLLPSGDRFSLIASLKSWASKER